ncbi:MAG: FAD-binding oxidoreductase [Sphingobacteriales bacterium]|nr:FAD-binding oxidoreductase [Sphingobacteriales bacterium]
MQLTFSYWEQQTFFSTYDVIIIGSGIVGLNAALHLKIEKPSLKIAIVERGILPSGASTKNAGFACFGSVSELMNDIKTNGEETVYRLVEKRVLGLKTLRNHLGDQAISYEQYGGYELFLEDDQAIQEASFSAIHYLNKLLKPIFGAPAIFTDSSDKITDFGFQKTRGLIFNRFEGQIDTGKMMQALMLKVRSLGVEIFNQCEVQAFEREDLVSIRTSIGVFKSKKVIFATNAFTSQLLPEAEILPGRGQVLVTEPIPDLKFKGTFHYDEGYYYFRNIDGRILLGGGRNLNFKAEESFDLEITQPVQERLELLLSEVIYPHKNIRIDYRWSGIMGFGEDLAPLIIKIDDSIYLAAKCNGMGVALGSLTGKEVAELVLNDI